MKIRYVVPALAAAAALVLTGCVNNESTEGGGDDTTAPETAGEFRTWAEIQESGVIHAATDADYPPNEYKDEDGNPIGWGVELTEAVAEELGLEVEWHILSFDSILPQIEGGTIDLGASSFTDTLERQQAVDFVNYYSAGSLWAGPVGSTVDPDDACGLTIAVQATTVQHLTELPARSDKCVEEGKPAIDILEFPGQPEATNAVVLGRADAFSADSPVTIDAVNELSDEIEIVGELFDSAPYGFAIAKGSDFAEQVRLAVQALMDSSRYMEILEAAGAEAGAIEEATINAGTE